VRAQAGIDVGQQAQVMRRVQALTFGQQACLGQHFLDELMPLLVQLDLAGVFSSMLKWPSWVTTPSSSSMC